MNKFLYKTTQYTKYRPQYPLALFEYLAELTPFKDTALDCGTGSGQAARDIAKYFKRVIATDSSRDLLDSAPQVPNIEYIHSKAERLPIQSDSIDLVCVAQALHWFPLDDFYKEVRRVLKPKGVIAAWVYNQCTIAPEVDNLIDNIYKAITTSENLSLERTYVRDHYQTIPFPFESIEPPKFEMEVSWNLTELLGYIATWPSILEYEKKYKADALSHLFSKFHSVWGNETEKKVVKWPIHLLVGCL